MQEAEWVGGGCGGAETAPGCLLLPRSEEAESFDLATEENFKRSQYEAELEVIKKRF